jgi:hypothetical protein
MPRCRTLLIASITLAGSLAGLPAWAARPMITDDARLVDAKSCQVESWVRRNRDSTEFWALPSCNFTGNLELTLGGSRTREAGRTETTDVVAQGKTLLRPLATDSWGVGLALGTVGQKPLIVSDQGLAILVAWGGIEPPTRGFSIRCSTN